MIHGSITIQRWKSYLPPFILGVSLWGLYLLTLAPGLTWANHGSDGGDLITAAATGGIPHPTGYPLYLLLARLFLFLPGGSLAFRTNLMSAVFTALAAIMIYKTVLRHLEATPAIIAVPAGLTAGFCFGLAPVVWSQAVISEVYALQAFLVAWIIYLYAKNDPGSTSEQKSLDRWRGLALGLALTNHMTGLVLVPVTLILGLIRRRVKGNDPVAGWQGRLEIYRFDAASLGRQLLWLSAGISLYLLLPLRALTHPPISWGSPITISRLIWLMSGRLYQGVYLQFRGFQLWREMQSWVDFSLVQLGWISIGIALLGLILFERFSRLLILTITVAVSSLVIKSFYRSPDSDVYLIPLLISLSIWLGIGTAGLAEIISKRSRAIGWGMGVLVLGIVLVRPVSYFHQVDASQDQRAESFGREVLSMAPENAILFAEGDEAVFALWYFHFAEHKRPDLAIVAQDLLQYDWYQESLQSAYPSLHLPRIFPWPETIARANGLRPVCYVQYADKTELTCTPPLATTP